MSWPCKISDMKPQESRTHCIRCGECCLESSPTLQREDLDLVRIGFLGRGDLYTIRKGELVRDNVYGRVIPADQEMIKVREKKDGNGGCIFYDGEEKACAIYENRPAQCASLKCWDTAEFLELYRRPKLDRRDVLENGVLLGLIEEQERRCSYGILEKLVKEIPVEGEDAVTKIMGLLKFDFYLRPFAHEKLNIPLEETDFFFGRPLIETIVMFGLKVIREPDGSFYLTRIENNGVLE